MKQYATGYKMNLLIDSWQNLAAVADLHMKYLSANGTSDNHAKELMLLYYQTCRDDLDNKLITVDINGELIGFVGLIESLSKLYLKLIVNNFFQVIRCLHHQMVYCPKTTANEIQNRIKLLIKNRQIFPRLFSITSPQTKNPSSYEVRPIVVAPAYRGTGVAQLLLREAEHFLRSRGVRNYFLRVEDTNDRAVRFYLKAGFQVVAKEPPNILVMARTLPCGS